MIVLQLPQVHRTNSVRPNQCKYCQCEILQRWGEVKKAIKDTKIRTVRVPRYYCTSCQRTFRHYPEGIDRAIQSERLKKLAVICWSFGLSYRSLSLILSAFGVSLSRMSGWRDVQQEAESIRKHMQWKGARVVGIDGAWMNGQGLMVAVDMGDGQPLAIGCIDEKDRNAVLRWLKTLKQKHGIGAIVTDDLAMYRGIADELELGHQVCQFHVKRWVGKACWELSRQLPDKWVWMLAEIKTIMDDLPSDGDRQLLDLYRMLPGKASIHEHTAVDALRHLLIRVSDSWDRYTAFLHDPGIPWTNNLSEQAIGKMKMRARTVRGYKTTPGMLNGTLISSSRLC